MDAWEHANRAMSGGDPASEPDDGLSGFGVGGFGKFAPDPVTFAQAIARPQQRNQHTIAEPAGKELLSPHELAVGNYTARQIAQWLKASTGTPVRLPSHNCPPVFARDFDFPLTTTAATTIGPANAGTTIVDLTLKPAHYTVLLGFAWTVAWTVLPNATDAFAVAPMTLLVNGNAHEFYRRVTVQLTNSLMFLVPVTWPISPLESSSTGTNIQIVVGNTDGALSIDVRARVKGYQFPVAGATEGIEGGLVKG